MTLWMIRAGSNDEFLPLSKERNLAILSFDPVLDLSAVTHRSGLRESVRAAHPEISDRLVTRWTNEIAAFLWEILSGDQIITPCKHGQYFLIGEVMDGPYRYRPDLLHPGGHIGFHTRPVNWVDELAREDVEPLWKQLQSQRTVSRLDSLRWIRPKHTSPSRLTPPNAYDDVLEGELRLAEAKWLRSRSRKIVAEKWEAHIRDNGGYGCCEACRFRHIDRGMFDVHHLHPIAMGKRRTATADLAVLCPRCHRLAHLKAGADPYSIGELLAMQKLALD